MTEQAVVTIEKAAEDLNDNQMLVRIAGIDLKSKEVKYHHSCKRDYLNQARSSQQYAEAQQSAARTVSHKLAFEKLKARIKTTFIDLPGAELLTSLHERYMS